MRSCGPLEECLIEWALFGATLDAWASICLMLPSLNYSLHNALCLGYRVRESNPDHMAGG